jgi:quercetin dioxygenase-like cupin family protein
MSRPDALRGHAVVLQPEDGPSFWQPVPASGHADPRLVPAVTRFDGLSMGYQTVAPGGRIREHSHGDQVELQICFRGRGRVVVDGASHPLVPGTACFLGYDVKHEIFNEGAEDLVLLWVVSPPGLERFFEAIGRPRRPGEAAPAPFARPADVVAIERSLGLNDTEGPAR